MIWTLNSLRYKRYCDKVKKGSKAVEAKNLPPSSAAARYHSLRVFFQIQEWKGDVSGLEPSEWGWEEVGGQLLPNTIDLPAAQSKCLRCSDASVKQGAAHFDAHVWGMAFSVLLPVTKQLWGSLLHKHWNTCNEWYRHWHWQWRWRWLDDKKRVQLKAVSNCENVNVPMITLQMQNK